MAGPEPSVIPIVWMTLGTVSLPDVAMRAMKYGVLLVRAPCVPAKVAERTIGAVTVVVAGFHVRRRLANEGEQHQAGYLCAEQDTVFRQANVVMT